ncbi:MAG: polysaccharide biosynthesis C-terminal domain-containing protein [Lachnospiraceae bacterium]|nr:polysaccharide biosynthesis C-terminal domain-containing protein [Lachnospiraceae bacterium]
MGKYKYLANNIALFSISSFVSKILVFLLVPFYTGVLTTTEYGTADVMQTTLLLLVPALTMNMGEAALRFGIERTDKRELIFGIGIRYTLRASLIVAAMALVAVFFLPACIVILFVILFFTNSIYEFLILFFQGCEQVKIVVSGSVFSTVILICSNLILLLAVKAGLYGYIISQILSYTAAGVLMLYLFEKHSGLKLFSGKREGEDKEFEAELLDYGRPMILYSTGAWINNAADRYFVSAMCGLSVNGLYGVAYKIPSILTVFQRIFAQAWQMSATKSLVEDKQEGSVKSAEFYSGMYRFYFTFMLVGCAFLILFVRLLALFLFRKDFYEAWRFVPLLLISVVFGAMTGFLGSICLAYKDSKSMGAATGTGALINLILNALLIPRYSAMGAAAATAVSYFVMFMMAGLFVSRYVKIKADHAKDITAVILVVLEAFKMITGPGGTETCLVCTALSIAVLLIYIKQISGYCRQILKHTVKEP